MAYLALYRAWRPQNFRDIVGQEHVVRTLRHAVEAGRTGHAYLFCGSRGTGKTTTAKVLAKALNCLNRQGAEPCNQCANCLAVNEELAVDVLEIDAASNRGIDEIRDLREKVKFAPATGQFRVYIIDEVHMLTNEAFNALLKTLEEPPRHVVFILATTEPRKMPLTILSRCQRFDFKPIAAGVISDRLRIVAQGAGIKIEDDALGLIARAAEGGLRDAISILDQAASFGAMRVTAEDVHNILGTVRAEVLSRMAGYLAAGETGAALSLLGELTALGKDLRLFAQELAAYLRALILRELTPANAPREDLPEADIANLTAFKQAGLLRAAEILLKTEQEMKWGSLPGVLLELAVVKICRPELTDDLLSLTARIELLEGKLAQTTRSAKDAAASALIPAAEISITDEEVPLASPEAYREVAALPQSKTKKSARKAKEAKKPQEQPEAAPPDLEILPEQTAPGVAAEQTGVSPEPPPGNEAAESLELEQLRQAWPELLGALKRAKPSLYPAFLSAAPLRVVDGVLTVGFPEGEELSLGMAERPVNKEFFAELLGRFPLACRQVHYVYYAGAAPLPAVPPAPLEDISRRFGGAEVTPDDEYDEELEFMFDDEG